MTEAVWMRAGVWVLASAICAIGCADASSDGPAAGGGTAVVLPPTVGGQGQTTAPITGTSPTTQPPPAGTSGTTGTPGTPGTASTEPAPGTTPTTTPTTSDPMVTGDPMGTAGMAAPTPMTTPSTVTTSGPGPRIPPMPASCPNIATGTITVRGQQVELWVGPPGQRGPMVFYWHGTGGRSSEAVNGLGPGLGEVMTQGGVVASFTTTTGDGQNTGNNVWYTGDFAMADEIFACAHAAGLVDERQVYTGGCSAGGLQASAMVYSRSSYLAAAMPNSGGTVFPYQLEDASHVPAMMSTHGAKGQDVVIIDFSDTTATQVQSLLSLGGFVVNCDHGGGHCRSPAEVKAAQWKFLKDHPFGVDPEPYASGLPAGTPAVCQIM